jgi:hypothetical protein
MMGWISQTINWAGDDRARPTRFGITELRTSILILSQFVLSGSIAASVAFPVTLCFRSKEGFSMTKFFIGLVIGLTIGMSATTWAAGCFGTGPAIGWTVIKDGDDVCTDPSINNDSKEIECE